MVLTSGPIGRKVTQQNADQSTNEKTTSSGPDEIEEEEMLGSIQNLASRLVMLTLAVSLVPMVVQAQEKAAVVVREFSIDPNTGWPYDVKQLQSQTVAELRAKASTRADVVVGPPVTPPAHIYTLDGEVVSWHPGNRAKRMMVGMGSGRETAEIHYWLSDEQGKKVFEHKDTIRAEFWGNEYASSVGQLAHPFASKIAGRLADAKLF